MEELLIDEKKYLSTKRAAKVTGYAKDYIGQLCREGRVKARQVGRSWYVLESDVRQHRFGSAEAGPPSVSIPKADETTSSQQFSTEAPKNTKPIDHTWEQPRYSPVYDEPPQINLLKKEPQQTQPDTVLQHTESSEHPPQVEPVEPLENLNEAWEAWFANNQNSAPETAMSANEAEPVAEESVPALQPEVSTEPSVRVAQEEEHDSPEEDQTEEMVPITRLPEPPMHSMQMEPVRTEAPITPHREETVREGYRYRTTAGTKVIRTISILAALGAIGIAYLQIDQNWSMLAKLPSSVGRVAGLSVYKISHR